MSPAKRRHMYRQPNFSSVVGTSCLDGRTDIVEVPPACSFFSSILFRRYVDNRLILAPSRILQNRQIRDFCRPDFYKGIQLESVEDHQRLGFTIDASARTTTFELPKKPWQIRSPASAGSWRLAASGFFPRAALIRVQAGLPKDSVPEPCAD